MARESRICDRGTTRLQIIDSRGLRNAHFVRIFRWRLSHRLHGIRRLCYCVCHDFGEVEEYHAVLSSTSPKSCLWGRSFAPPVRPNFIRPYWGLHSCTALRCFFSVLSVPPCRRISFVLTLPFYILSPLCGAFFASVGCIGRPPSGRRNLSEGLIE